MVSSYARTGEGGVSQTCAYSEDWEGDEFGRGMTMVVDTRTYNNPINA